MDAQTIAEMLQNWSEELGGVKIDSLVNRTDAKVVGLPWGGVCSPSKYRAAKELIEGVHA